MVLKPCHQQVLPVCVPVCLSLSRSNAGAGDGVAENCRFHHLLPPMHQHAHSSIIVPGICEFPPLLHLIISFLAFLRLISLLLSMYVFILRSNFDCSFVPFPFRFCFCIYFTYRFCFALDFFHLSIKNLNFLPFALSSCEQFRFQINPRLNHIYFSYRVHHCLALNFLSLV